MTDETNPIPAVDTATGDASSKTKTMKTRAPRKPKAATEAVINTSTSVPVKKTRGPGKQTAVSNTPVTSEVVAPTVKAPTSARKPVALNAQPPKPAQPQVTIAPAETDGFAELLKLEEENQQLRKALSEKLRAENADLRKKLGMA
jgi:putative transposase